MRSLCSEFPCDNPSLHFGGTWVLLETTGAAAFVAATEAPPVAALPEVTPSDVTAKVADADRKLVEEPPATVVAEVLASLLMAEAEEDEEEDEDEEVEKEALASAEAVAAAEGSQASQDEAERAAELVASDADTDLEPETVVGGAAELRESGVFLAAESASSAAAVLEEEPQEETLPIVLAAIAPQAEEVAEEATTQREEGDDVDAFCMLLETVAVQFGGESAAEVVHSWLRDEDSPMAEERAPWLALLRGGECDLSGASAATLDEWASKMLSQASGRDAAEIRRELRNRGLAAYGLLAA